MKHEYVLHLNVHLGSSPVSSLSIVTDSVVGSQSDPLWQWSVLFLSLSHFLLDSERLLSLIKKDVSSARRVYNCKMLVTVFEFNNEMYSRIEGSN